MISRYTGGSVDNSKSGPPLNACNFAAVIQTLFYQKFFTILFFFPLAKKSAPLAWTARAQDEQFPRH